MCGCDICEFITANGRCLCEIKGLKCNFRPNDKKLIEYANRMDVTVIEAIELWKFHLAYEESTFLNNQKESQ